MKIAVLGGIGAEASAYFYKEIIIRLQKRGKINSNTQYPQIIINSIPARELHSEQDVTKNVVEDYIEGIKELNLHKPEFIVMVCNTIHVFLDNIEAQIGLKNILSLSDILKRNIADKKSTLCILGTGLTISRNLYVYPEHDYVALDNEDRFLLNQIIRRHNLEGAKSFEDNLKALLKIINKQKDKGAETFIAACTEVSELLNGIQNFDYIDTLELLIDETVSLIVKKMQSKYDVSYPHF